MGTKGEKFSNFSQTCRLLSQYLKENGSLGGLALEMAPKGKYLAPTTMNLLPGLDAAEKEEQVEKNPERNPPKSMDLFPQNSGFSSAVEESAKNSDIGAKEKGQLTIFYGGKVLVFDDFPAEKANNLMQMANMESIAAQNVSFSAPAPAPAPAPAAPADCPSKSPPQETLSKTNASDMPIARRNSLHRFLEKRKDRISTKAPYQVNGLSALANEGKPESSQPWLNFGNQATKPEASSLKY
ncbi:protein TIFY 10b-like [Canna indica]|uniref:Protein TIFY n=1 Tax=Canna indica TaxID=4628 RepID=A0AAQ3L5U5_9LILI|nr:protein TIFY 10b-like [Canna indica]